MDRTFGKPAKPPVPPVVLIPLAYGLVIATLFIPGAIVCDGATLQTLGGLALVFAALAITAIVGVTARNRFAWKIPVVIYAAWYLLFTMGPLSPYGIMLSPSGEKECVIF